MPNQFEKLLQSSSAKICAIAAPGSGKTTGILIPKANEILSDENIAPNEVLLLTFSRLSAQDLKNKVKKLDRVPKATTVHSFALSFLLSEDNHDIRKRVDSIVLDFEREILLSDLKVAFPSVHKNTLREDLKEFSAGWATQQHDQVFEENDGRRAFKAAVVNWLVEHEAAMMEEILYFAVDLAKKVPDAEMLEEPKYILIDEYQDLNKLEQEFVDLVAQTSNLLVVVGDPDQSIYAFKYAHPHGINLFSKRGDVDTHIGFRTHRCPKKVIYYANQLLKQADPGRTVLVNTPDSAIDGAVEFVRRDKQDQEFKYVLNSIAKRIHQQVDPKEIIVLVPRKKLGGDFVQYANANRMAVAIPNEINFAFVLKPDFTDLERERILLFGIIAKPDSLLHNRSYLGIHDVTHFATELSELKAKYGNLKSVLDKADFSDFSKKKVRVGQVCLRIKELRSFLQNHDGEADLNKVLDELFPGTDPQVAQVRTILSGLIEVGDSVQTLYSKFVDYMRAIPSGPTQIRVMTLMASKGLDADHVYIMGCNDGNLPGERRLNHLSDLEHNQEQLRLLYVGFTRSKKSLTVTWSRHLSFAQSKNQFTGSVGTVYKEGKPHSKVGMCKFLQDLSDVHWQ
jgi:superfamily I DNA/RNA helicase